MCHLNPAMSLGRYLRTLWGRARAEDGANDRGIGEKASFLNIQGCFAMTADIPPAITPHLQLIFVFVASCPRCVHFSGRFKRFNVAGAALLAVASLCSYVRPRWPCRPGLARFGPLALERYAVFFLPGSPSYTTTKRPVSTKTTSCHANAGAWGDVWFLLLLTLRTGKEWNLNISQHRWWPVRSVRSIWVHLYNAISIDFFRSAEQSESLCFMAGLSCVNKIWHDTIAVFNWEKSLARYLVSLVCCNMVHHDESLCHFYVSLTWQAALQTILAQDRFVAKTSAALHLQVCHFAPLVGLSHCWGAFHCFYFLSSVIVICIGWLIVFRTEG